MNLSELWTMGTDLSEVQQQFPVRLWIREQWTRSSDTENEAMYKELCSEMSGTNKVTLPLRILANASDIGTVIELIEDITIGYRPNGEISEVRIWQYNISNPQTKFDDFSGIVGPLGGLPLVKSAFNEEENCQIIAYRKTRLILSWRWCHPNEQHRLDGERELYRIRACQL